jgi:hypothetical protein
VKGERRVMGDVGVGVMVEVMVMVVVFWLVPGASNMSFALIQPSRLIISPVGDMLGRVRVKGGEVIVALA